MFDWTLGEDCRSRSGGFEALLAGVLLRCKGFWRLWQCSACFWAGRVAVLFACSANGRRSDACCTCD